MFIDSNASFSYQSRKARIIYLAFSSCLGSSFGIYTAGLSSFDISFLMRMAGVCRVSIVGLAAVTLLPLLITAAAVLLSKPNLLFLLTFAKACLYSYCLYGICCGFTGAGLLVCFLLLFSDSAVVLLIHWFSFRNICGFTDSSFRELLGIIVFCISVGIVDYCIVSSFLTSLILF